MELGISGAAVSIALPDIVLRKVKKKLVFFRPSMLHFIRTINEQIQNIAQKKDTLCRMMYN